MKISYPIMIKRLVKLTLLQDEVETFLSIFNDSKNKVKSFPGCLHLELLRDVDNPAVMFTLSHWESLDALNKYRNSEFFKNTWSKTRLLFAAKASAWSVEVLGEPV
jgi:heme-degrading monooxygenase HmoA